MRVLTTPGETRSLISPVEAVRPPLKMPTSPKTSDWQSSGHTLLHVRPALLRPRTGLAEPSLEVGKDFSGFCSEAAVGGSPGVSESWDLLGVRFVGEPALSLRSISVLSGRDGPTSGQASPCASEHSPSPQSPQNNCSGKYSADPKNVAVLKVPHVPLRS